MCCCRKSEWRNERKVVQDHKFDFVDIDQFYERSAARKFKYCLVFVVLLKTILVYIADLWTAGILLIFDKWGSSVKPKIPIFISKWIFVGAIIMSFVILALDIRKARPIIASRDISYTFTSLVATRYYTLRSYAHYCFFCQVQESTKLVDDVAFFVFFSFKGWKRLIFAELPRQAVNAVTLYSLIQSNHTRRYWDIKAYGDNVVQQFAVALMAFTLIVFILSFSMLCVAFIMYIPLLCHIRGNLKEYCCHKVDKRIAELIKMKSRRRIAKNKEAAEALAKGDYSRLKDKKGNIVPLKEPTLPVVIDGPPAPVYAGVPPPYVSRPGSPNFSVPSRTGTPAYPSRTGTPQRTGTPPIYRTGTPSRPGTPGYGNVPPNGQQPNPVLTRRNSASSVMSGMTNVSSYSSYSTSYGSGGYHPYGLPNRSQTPPSARRGHENNLIARAVLNSTQNYTPSDDDDRQSEYGGSQSSSSENNNRPVLNKYNEHDLYRAPSPGRSYSPAPSVSSTTSNPRSRPPNGPQGAYPSRYQQDYNRTPRYNNYTQQGGGPNRN